MNQEKFVRDVLKKFMIEDCARINTPVECGVKMSKNDEREKINSTTFKCLVGSLRYLICTRLNILFGVELVNKFMGTPIMTHFKTMKRILQYIKGTVHFGLFYRYSNRFELVGYSDSDWAGDMNDRNNTTGFVFYIEDNIHMEFKEAIYSHFINM
jgi:hypothetical protein